MAGIDQRGRLEQEPFDYRVNKDGKLLILYEGKLVKTLKGKAAQKLLSRIEGADSMQVQLALAKVTGNFKRGNERRGK